MTSKPRLLIIFFFLLVASIFAFYLFIINKKVNTEFSNTTINANIYNLPDGKIFLLHENKVIDSANVQNGKFTFKHPLAANEPLYLSMIHIAGNNKKTFFTFNLLNKDIKNSKSINLFMSDPDLNLNSSLTYDTETERKYNLQERIARIDITGGQQTDALLDVDPFLFDDIKNNIVRIESAIREYPYSFHLLYNIKDRQNEFSDKQLTELLKLFDESIKKAPTYKYLEEYIKLRQLSQSKVIVSQLLNSNGDKEQIINPRLNKHLIVFWASWCIPCRMDIPVLKKIDGKIKNLEIVSISVDKDEGAWKNALEKEDMAWKQLISIAEEKNLRAQFLFSGTLPYFVLIDNNFKILKTHTGTLSETELHKLITE